MTRNNHTLVVILLVGLLFTGCDTFTGSKVSFDEFKKIRKLDNWQFALDVENQNKKHNVSGAVLKANYIKATLYVSNTKTKNSLLYSASKDVADYEEKYKYLSFGSKNDLFIKHNNDVIYPIGYVFEPSNGLSNSEKLVYKFQIDEKTYRALEEDKEAVEYWYVDKLAGVGKICFNNNN